MPLPDLGQLAVEHRHNWIPVITAYGTIGAEDSDHPGWKESLIATASVARVEMLVCDCGASNPIVWGEMRRTSAGNIAE